MCMLTYHVHLWHLYKLCNHASRIITWAPCALLAVCRVRIQRGSPRWPMSASDGGDSAVSADAKVAKLKADAEAAWVFAEKAAEDARGLLSVLMALDEDDEAGRAQARKLHQAAKKHANTLTRKARSMEKAAQAAARPGLAAIPADGPVPERPKRLRLKLARKTGDPRATTGAVLRQGPIMEHGVGFKRRLLFHGMPWPRPAVVDEAAAAGDGSGSDASVPHEQGSIDVGGPDAEGPQE